MFCPHCGQKQDGTPLKCSVCKKTIPPLGAPAQTAATPQRPNRPTAAANMERYASVGDRMLALLFDRALIGAFALIVAAAVADQRHELGVPPALVTGAGGALLLVFVIFLYHFIFEAGFGTTLGKAVMGIQVRYDADRNRFAAVAIRNALRVVDAIGLYLVGFLFATFGRRRQRVGDAVGGTVVLDLQMSAGARAAMLALLLIAIAAAIWIAWAICPTCV